MEFELARWTTAMLEIVSANFPEIRLLTMPQGKGFDSVASFERLHEWSDWSSRHFRKGDWDVCSPETVREFSAIGYVFGRRLHMAAGVPIGLIDASIGGTTVETWTPEDVVRGIDGRETQGQARASGTRRSPAYDPQADLQKRIAELRAAEEEACRGRQARCPPTASRPSDLRPGPVADRNRPGYCYASVIRPLEGLAVSGRGVPPGLQQLLRRLGRGADVLPGLREDDHGVAASRSAMPSCRSASSRSAPPASRRPASSFLQPMYDVGPLIREAQYRTFRDFRDAGDEEIGFVSSFDLRKSWYHPQIKIPAGERAAKWALATQYGILHGAGCRAVLASAVDREDGGGRRHDPADDEHRDHGPRTTATAG